MQQDSNRFPKPIYGMNIRDNDFLASYVKIMLEQGNGSPKNLKTWGCMCKDQDKRDESAAGFTIDRLKKKFNFEVGDFNFDDKEHYKYMYERINNR